MKNYAIAQAFNVIGGLEVDAQKLSSVMGALKDDNNKVKGGKGVFGSARLKEIGSYMGMTDGQIIRLRNASMVLDGIDAKGGVHVVGLLGWIANEYPDAWKEAVEAVEAAKVEAAKVEAAKVEAAKVEAAKVAKLPKAA